MLNTVRGVRHARTRATEMLTEGIKHLDALNVDEFVTAIRNIGSYVATEKLDGYNLWVGFDDLGLYTSRAGKGGKMFRSVDDYEDRPAHNAFRSAHKALQRVSRTLSTHIKVGECVEVEVLFGEQPNAISYGERNVIAFLRYVGENVPDDAVTRIEGLARSLSAVKVTVRTPHTITGDGTRLHNEEQTHTWHFSRPRKISVNVDLSDELRQIDAFLSSPSHLEGWTCGEVLTLSLNKISRDIRELFVQERERLQTVFEDKFKTPIKSKLLRELTPSRTQKNGATPVDFEGIVFLDPETNDQFKLVDRDVFTAANNFNFAVRSAIKTTGPRRADPNVLSAFGISSTGTSLMDDLARSLGAILGISSDLRYYTVKRTLASFGETPQEIVSAIAANISDFKAARLATAQSIQRTGKRLHQMLQTFKTNWQSGQKQLANGMTVTYTPEVYRRTLTSFAETSTQLRHMLDAVKACKRPEELVAVVFSDQLRRIGALDG